MPWTPYLDGWRNALDFAGRARRAEFWLYILINRSLLYGGFWWTFSSGVLQEPATTPDPGFTPGLIAGLVATIVVLTWMTLGELSVAFRRLHDVGKSGWTLLFWSLPPMCLIGWLVLLVHFCRPSGDNNEWGFKPGEEHFTIRYH